MAREIIRKDKVCLVCGTTFKGIASAQTCSPACRAALVRIKDSGKRPEFIQIAKGKGQKIPDLNAPKRLKFKKGEKKKPENPELPEVPEIIFTATTPECYDGEKSDRTDIMDETLQWDSPKPLTKEEKLTKWHEVQRQIDEEKKRPFHMKGSPKAFSLQQAMIIDNLLEIQKQYE